MLSGLLDAAAITLLTLGLIVATIGLYGVLRMPDIYRQLHAAGTVSGVGVIAILLASVATRNAAVIAHAALVIAFVLLTAPIATHAIAWAAHRRRAVVRDARDTRGHPVPPE
ncbi:MAG TPA: monovalent cation/H(+) antiporter subunit G [Methylomirabilota bacterium]|jgi:multicomponent Na+:H+ antiporter subunit G|nr:monovalent cation/H(+) antiporter subunit G [Methylomirabilota bacterium]